MERCSLCKGLSFAISIGDCRSTFCARRQATIYAVAVGIVSHDKHAAFSICRREETETQQGNKAEQRCPHKVLPMSWKGGFNNMSANR
jgi:hypothetical protein